MLFITYWELNENSNVAERFQAARGVMEAGLHEPDGVSILRFDITPDNWGILVMEADSNEAIGRATAVWRTAFPGIFKMSKTAPALPIQEAMSRTAELLADMNS